MRQIQARNRALTVKLMSILHFHRHSMHELTWRASRQPVYGKRVAAKMPKPGHIPGAARKPVPAAYRGLCCAQWRAYPRFFAAQSHIQNTLHLRYYGAQDHARIRNHTPRKAMFRMHFICDIGRSRPCSHAQSCAAQSHIQDAHDARYQRAPTCPDRRRTICFPFCSRCCNAPPPLRIVCRMEVSRFATGIQTYS